MDIKSESLGQRLKRLREEKAISIKEVAEKIGVPLTTYREWEHGRKIVGEPYAALANLLGVSIYELITGEKLKEGAAITTIDLIQNELGKLRQHLLSKD